MKLYSGIDLHSNNSVVTILDEEDRVVAERRVANELELIHGLLAPYSDALVGVVVESTYNWYWLVDGLMEHGLKFTWRTRLPSSSTAVSSILMTATMHAGWLTCSDWGC